MKHSVTYEKNTLLNLYVAELNIGVQRAVEIVVTVVVL